MGGVELGVLCVKLEDTISTVTFSSIFAINCAFSTLFTSFKFLFSIFRILYSFIKFNDLACSAGALFTKISLITLFLWLWLLLKPLLLLSLLLWLLPLFPLFFKLLWDLPLYYCPLDKLLISPISPFFTFIFIPIFIFISFPISILLTYSTIFANTKELFCNCFKYSLLYILEFFKWGL